MRRALVSFAQASKAAALFDAMRATYNVRMDDTDAIEKKRKPGRPRGSGAPLIYAAQLAPVRVTPEQRATWRRLGGAAWLRRMLDVMRESTDTK